jgi:hypothetical protein
VNDSEFEQAQQAPSAEAVMGWRYYELRDIASCLRTPSRFGNTADELRSVMKDFGKQIDTILAKTYAHPPAPLAVSDADVEALARSIAKTFALHWMTNAYELRRVSRAALESFAARKST